MPQPPDSNRNLGTYVALGGLLLAAGCLLFLISMVMPHVLGILGVVAGFVGIGLFHYVVWGRWLSVDDEE